MTYEEEQTLDGALPELEPHGLDLDAALERLSRAKAAEASANAARLAAETAVLAFCPARDEGSVTVAGTAHKVTITYGMNRTLDAAALDAVRGAMAPALFEQAIEFKPAIKLPGLRYLKNNEPAAYAVLAQAITAKPAKPSIRIEPINANQDP